MDADAKNTDTIVTRAQQMAAQNRWQETQDWLEARLGELPATGLYLLGLAALKCENLPKAEYYLTAAINAAPDHTDALYYLGCAQRFLGKTQLAVTTFNTLVKYDPERLDGWMQMAGCMRLLGKFSIALRCYQQVEQRNPEHPDLYAGMALVYDVLDDRANAAACFEKALKQKPADAQLLYNYVQSRKNRPDEPHVATLLQLHAQQKQPSSAKMLTCYALAKIHEQQKDHARAFELFREANQIQSQLMPSDAQTYIDLYRATTASLPASKLTELSRFGFPDTTPIFIIGMPRSGTSLVEQILASHSKVEGAGELAILDNMATHILLQMTGKPYPEALLHLTPAQIEQLGRHYVQQLRAYGTAPHIVDKMPQNYQYLPLIHVILPRARIIHCRRDAIDTCWSLWRTYFPFGLNYKSEFKSLASVYHAYDAFMRHWDATLPQASYALDYETLIADTEAQIRALLEYCGLNWEESCLAFQHTKRAVNTASAHQVRQPINKEGLQSWLPVKNQLAPLIDALKAQ